MEVIAVAKNIHRSPRKVRLVLDAVRGKSVDEAVAILRFLPHGGAPEVLKVVRSAAANAENNYQMAPEDLRQGHLRGRRADHQALSLALAWYGSPHPQAVESHYGNSRGKRILALILSSKFWIVDWYWDFSVLTQNAKT